MSVSFVTVSQRNYAGQDHCSLAKPKWEFPRGRCRLHGGATGSGAPPGERNGQYWHGEWTKGAIAERRKFSALLKVLRATSGHG